MDESVKVFLCWFWCVLVCGFAQINMSYAYVKPIPLKVQEGLDF